MKCPCLLPNSEICGAPMMVLESISAVGVVCRHRICQGTKSHHVFTEEKIGQKRLLNLLRADVKRMARATIVFTATD